jgi:hypothetical protein
MSQSNEGETNGPAVQAAREAREHTGTRANAAGATPMKPGRDAPSGEEELRAQLREVVRKQPWVSLAAALAAGGVLGGIGFSRLGRLTFAAAAGFVAHELWHREGRMAVDEVLAKFRDEEGDEGDRPAPLRARSTARR